MAWDVTVGATLAESYVEVAVRESGAVAEQAAQRKLDKCRDAFPNYCFQQIAVENLGVMNSSAVDFINTLGRCISSVSGEDRICLPVLMHFCHHSTLQQYSVVRVFSP